MASCHHNRQKEINNKNNKLKLKIMRKITSLLVLLCMFVGTAWGQISTTEISPEKWYYLKCIAADAAHANGANVWLSDKGSAFAGKSATPTSFQFHAAGDGQYYIYSSVSKKYMNVEADNSISQGSTATTKWTVGKITDADAYVYISPSEKNYLNNAGGTNNIQIKNHSGGVSSGNPCSLWYITEATPEVVSGKVYRIINKANANKTISEQSDFLMKAINKDENDLSQLWYVEGSNAVGYTLRNLKTADYFDYVNENYTHWGTTATPKKYYIGKAENADGETPAYFYITYDSSAAPETLASAHYSGERIVRWRWADKSGENYTNVNASLWQFEEVEIDAVAKMNEAYSTWYSTMASSITDAQNIITESAYSSIPFTLTNSNTTCPAAIADNSDGGGVPALLDEDDNTFMHTKYSGKGSVGEPHYIQVDLGENNSAKFITFSYKARHNNQNNNPETIIVKGSTDGTNYTDIQTLTNLPDGLIEYTSNIVGNGTSYRYFRFVVTATSNNAKHEDYVFFSLAKFRLNTVAVNDTYASKLIALAKLSKWIENNLFDSERPADWCLISSNNIQTEIRDLLYACTLREYPFNLTADVNNPICYQILSGRGNNDTHYYFTLKPNDNGKVKLETTTQNNIYTYWFFMEDAETGRLMVLPFIDESNPLGYTTVTDGADKLTNVHSTQNFAGYYYEVIEYAGVDGFPYALKPYGASTNVSNHGGTGNFMGFYNGNNDGGTAVKFNAVTTPALEYRTLRAAIASAISKRPGSDNIGTMLHGYSTESFNAYNAKITEAEGLYNNVSETTVEQLNETVSQLNNLYFVLEINQPVDGKFYRLRCADTGNGMKYLQCTQNTDANRFDMISGAEGKTVNETFCYINGGLVPYVKPMYIGHEDNKASWNMSPVPVLFQAAGSGAIGEYNIKLGSRYLYGKNAKSDSGTSGTDVMTNADKGYHWWLEEVETIPVTITAAKYATFYAPCNVTLPNEGLKAYYIASATANSAKMQEITGGVIPANTGVILEGAEGTYTLTIGGEASAVANMLTGTVASAYVTDDAYVLSKQGENVGMYMAKKNFVYNEGAWTKVPEDATGSHFLNNGFKAYLPKPTGSSARFLVFDFGTETGIDQLEGENGNVKTEVYDLSGRRVQSAQKGIFIVNGKKVIR